MAHVLAELRLVPPRRQLHLALQRRELSQQRLLPLGPAQGLPLQLGTWLWAVAVPLRPQAAVPSARPRPRGLPRRRPPRLPRGTAPGAAGGGPVPRLRLGGGGRGRRPVAARREVGGQVSQPDGAAAAPRAVVALDLQLLDEAAEGQDGAQLGGRQRLAAQRAPPPPRRPGQQAAGAEDVPARRGQWLLQHPPAELALQLHRHRRREARRVEAHGAAGDRETFSAAAPARPRRRWSRSRRAGGGEGRAEERGRAGGGGRQRRAGVPSGSPPTLSH